MIPIRLGPYTIASRLGRGGMGTVYEAVDATTGQTVAVKVLSAHLADDAALRGRFEDEIETLKNLRHPGIVRLLAYGEEDGQPYFAMELVRGKSLEQWLREGRHFGWRETVAIAADIARALKVAHDHGVVHRDLKPANLLVTDPAPEAGAGGVTVKLADFGIAKLFGGVAHTAHGNVVGTAEYMAPEQAAGRPVDQRADLYALGLVMYAMLTGSPPFKGRQLTEVIGMQQRVVPPRVSTLVGDVPPELDELIARLLAKDPAQRPANALALTRLLAAIDMLHPAATSPAGAASPAASPPAGSPPAGSPPAVSSPAVSSQAARPSPASPAAAPTAPRAPAVTAHDVGQAATRPVADAGSPAVIPPGGPVLGGAVPGGPVLGGIVLDPTREIPPGTADVAATTVGPAYAVEPASRAPTSHGPATSVTRDFTAAEPRRDAATARDAGGQPPDPRRTDGPRSGGLSTGTAKAVTHVDRGPRNRFVTVDDYERVAAEQDRRTRARESWWQWTTAIAMVAAVPVGAWLLLRPPSADRLHERIMTVADRYARARATADTADDDAVDLRDVRDDVTRFLERHPDDPRTVAVQGVKQELDLNALETRAKRLWNDDRGLSPVKQEYLEAVGRPGAAARREALTAFLDAHGQPAADADADERLLPALARRTLERLEAGARREQAHDPARAAALVDEAAALDAEAAATTDAERRAALTGRARRLRRSVVTIYGDDPHAAGPVAAAKQALTPSAAIDTTAPADDTSSITAPPPAASSPGTPPDAVD